MIVWRDVNTLLSFPVFHESENLKRTPKGTHKNVCDFFKSWRGRANLDGESISQLLPWKHGVSWIRHFSIIEKMLKLSVCSVRFSTGLLNLLAPAQPSVEATLGIWLITSRQSFFRKPGAQGGVFLLETKMESDLVLLILSVLSENYLKWMW